MLQLAILLGQNFAVLAVAGGYLHRLPERLPRRFVPPFQGSERAREKEAGPFNDALSIGSKFLCGGDPDKCLLMDSRQVDRIAPDGDRLGSYL